MICTAQTVPGRLFDTVRYREGQERAGTKAAETQKKVVKRRTLVYDDTSFMELRETGTA